MAWWKKVVETVMEIDAVNIGHVYSGRPGCACGCRGMHTYHSSLAGQGKALRGYEFGAIELNDARIVQIVRAMNQCPDDLQYDREGVYTLDTNKRLYFAYTFDYIKRNKKAA